MDRNIGRAPVVIKGESYELGFLEPFTYSIGSEGQQHRIYVEFHCHCFVDKYNSWIGYKWPGSDYSDGFQLRSFSFDRYEWSKCLPETARTLCDRNVYFSDTGTYFTVRDDVADTSLGLYVVRFELSRMVPAPGAADIYLHVRTAYADSELTNAAPWIKFSELVEAVRTGNTPESPRKRAVRAPPLWEE